MAGKRNLSLVRYVVLRDWSICQACGFLTHYPEVHHIQRLELGGADTEDNMVTLCGDCHDEAPINPSEFVEYQRHGGNIWPKWTQYSLQRLRSFGGKSADDVLAAIAQLREFSFGRSLDTLYFRFGMTSPEHEPICEDRAIKYLEKLKRDRDRRFGPD